MSLKIKNRVTDTKGPHRSLKIKLHWAERFMDWYPHHTSLVSECTGDPHVLRKELFDALAAFFDELKEEAREEGRQQERRRVVQRIEAMRDAVVDITQVKE